MERGEGELFSVPDPEGFRRAMRDTKPVSSKDKRMDEHEAVSRLVREGDYVATDMYGMVRGPMSVVREIVRQRPGRLAVAGQGGLEIDMLVASGLVDRIDGVYIGHEVFGLSDSYRRAAQSGKLRVTEWTNAALAWRLKAAAMGIPCIPTRTMLGTDTFKKSAAATGKCPFSGERLCLLPALEVDVGIIHVHRCDRSGNAQIDGTAGLGYELARASRRLILSTEKVVPETATRRHPERNIIPGYLVDAVVEAPFGAHPGEMCHEYAMDRPRVEQYLEAMKTEQGCREYLDRYVRGPKSHDEYLELMGGKRKMRRLASLCRGR